MLIIGLETSCDETSVAIVEDGAIVRSNVIASQIELHAKTGGVVPEVASREHVEHVNAVIKTALDDAGLSFSDLHAVAVANRPGLMGALMVGVSAAKALSYALNLPLIGVHHIEAHIYANFLSGQHIDFPLVCLVASGGHTQIFLMHAHGDYVLLGRTLDDAAGEAFDKSARVLNLGYPGGVVIDKLSKTGNPKAINFPRARLGPESLDFSFSGLKTAVLNAASAGLADHSIEDWCASVQDAIVDVLVEKTMRAAKANNVKTVLAAGGVAANSRLQSTLQTACRREGFHFRVPEKVYCTDNAAMIGCAGYYHILAGHEDGLDLDVIATEALA
jgi:N6-L-threonylcarbamoyladenine synthase